MFAIFVTRLVMLVIFVTETRYVSDICYETNGNSNGLMGIRSSGIRSSEILSSGMHPTRPDRCITKRCCVFLVTQKFVKTGLG